MRIHMIVYGGLRNVSGGFLYDRMLVKSLTSHGHRVRVSALPWRGYVRSLLDNFGGAVARRLRPVRTDLILQDELVHPSVIRWNEIHRRVQAAPIVAIVHHLRSSERHPAWIASIYRSVERRYLRSADAFVFNSLATRSSVASLLGRPARGVVAYPGVDHVDRVSARAIRRPSGRPLRVIFLGNLIPRKRLPDLLTALAAVPEGWELTVVGRPPAAQGGYAAGLRRRAESMPEDRVRFAGRLPAPALWRELARSDVLAVPSDYEGFGLAYLEAMALGVVPIASDRGGAAELIRDGYNGFLVPPRRPEALADRLRRLAADRELCDRLRRAARRTARSWIPWRKSGKLVHEFLMDLVHPAGGIRPPVPSHGGDA
jgi:glycosyltransferase involved in cell wall biosynthesis